MNPELGHFALIMGFCVAFLQALFPLWGALGTRGCLLPFARHAAFAQALCLSLAFASLTFSFIENDFSVQYVADHSSTLLPWFYRITAVWGSHEGSLLLWTWILAAWSVAVALFSKKLPPLFLGRVLGFMGAISVGFLAFTLFTSNPFERLFPVPAEGHGLNPLLQDPGMILHPPLLYMGYVGFSVSFAFAMAALIDGRLDAAWARWVRPWVAVAWVFLTAGIAVGSFWAYYELGWGGWWFWDPVENASLMPWLVGTALLHSLAVTEKRGAFKHWTLLLAIAAFALSLLGTFLVRSGVLTSVHAFATDPLRGQFLLGFLVIVVAFSLLMYAFRAPRMERTVAPFSVVSRETALLANNVMLAAVTACVLLGTLYPLFMDALNLGKISVGAAYFEAVFAPLMFPVVFLMMKGPFMRWKAQDPHALFRTLLWPFTVSLVLALLIATVLEAMRLGMVMGLFLASWVFIASFLLLQQRLMGPPQKAQQEHLPFSKRLLGISASFWGMWLAHLGVGVFVLGVTLVNGLQTQKDVRLGPGESGLLGSYHFTLRSVESVEGPNYHAARAQIEITEEGRFIAVLAPERRLYLVRKMPMTEVGLDMGLWRDLYVALGEPLADGRWIVQFYIKPFIGWIWAGCLLMAIGGLLAAGDRRYRRP
jgi:cytochrome c-type biogenesis protein CcmF